MFQPKSKKIWDYLFPRRRHGEISSRLIITVLPSSFVIHATDANIPIVTNTVMAEQVSEPHFVHRKAILVAPEANFPWCHEPRPFGFSVCGLHCADIFRLVQ